MTETILTNALLVLPDAVRLGTVVMRDGGIVAVSAGRSAAPGAIDLDGDHLLPGVVDLHTDNLERQVRPRTNVRWPSRSAMMAHDAQCAAAGVTTVLDAFYLGDLGFEQGRIQTFREGVADLDALGQTGLLKSEHFLHLRCEMSARGVLDLLDPVAEHPRVRMISFMDHTPGIGQYHNPERYRELLLQDGMAEALIAPKIEALRVQRDDLRAPNRRALLDRIAHLDVALASHDDRTEAEIEENFADGIRISEFPVTIEAALAAKSRRMEVVAGGPNIVRGGSHTGNVAAADLVRAGAVDALASDYVPASLIEAAFLCVGKIGITLPRAVALLTDRPARMAHLSDRGRIEAGLRADLVRLRAFEGMPVVRQVWRCGERVA
jgi:alpha-D-ribose 1-methylphosphonate 5-triphosphate diphosphatase